MPFDGLHHRGVDQLAVELRLLLLGELDILELRLGVGRLDLAQLQLRQTKSTFAALSPLAAFFFRVTKDFAFSPVFENAAGLRSDSWTARTAPSESMKTMWGNPGRPFLFKQVSRASRP
jgi:hypothetical protein